MKPRSCQNGGLSSRLLLLNALVLTLACLQGVLSEDQKPIETKGWIEISDQSWPTADGDDTSPFLVYHSEYVQGPQLGLNAKLLDGVDHVTDPDLSFRYWAKGEAGSTTMRSGELGKEPKRDFKLDPSGWKQSPSLLEPVSGIAPRVDLKSISPNEWSNFAFSNLDLFTLALKGVNVKYVERVDLSKITDDITAYRDKPEPKNFKPLTATTPAETRFSIDATTKAITFDTKTAKSLTFDISEFKATKILVNLKEGPDAAVNLPVLGVANVGKDEDSKLKGSALSDATQTIKTLKITVTKDSAIISIKYSTDGTDPKTDILSEELGNALTDPAKKTAASNGPLVYNYVESEGAGPVKSGYIPLASQITAKKDNCYTIEKVNADKAIVNVYVALKGANAGIKIGSLDKTNNKLEGLCIQEQFGLQNIGDYLLTLTVEGTLVATGPSISNIKVTPSQKDYTFTLKKLTDEKVVANTAWYIYSPNFDYTITTKEVVELFVCDVAANCYPFDVKPGKATGERLLTIPEKVRPELVGSPYIRVKGPLADEKATFATKFDDQAKKSINSKMVSDNANYLGEKSLSEAKTAVEKDTVPAELKYTLKVVDGAIKLTLPLEQVDLRVHELTTRLALVSAADGKTLNGDEKNKFTVTRVSYRRATEKDSYDFPSNGLELPALSFSKQFAVATDQFFKAEDSAPGTGNVASIELTVELEKPNTYEVEINFVIKRQATKVVEEFSRDATDDKGHLTIVPITAEDNKANNHQLQLKKKEVKLFVTNWIHSGFDLKLKDLTLDTQISIASVNATNEISPHSVDIYKVVLGQGYPSTWPLGQSVAKPDATNPKTKITFTDNSKSDDTYLKGDFRIGYVVRSNEDFDLTVTIDKFAIKGAAAKSKDDNCKKGLTIASTDCEHEQLNCFAAKTASFDLQTTDKESYCVVKKLNRISEVKCDMAKGCSNILDRALPVSKNYDPPKRADGSDYVPFQIPTVKEESTEHYLQFNRPDAAAKGDFCVSFVYSADITSLTVSVLPDEAGITLPITPKEAEQDGKVCASWLTDEPEQVYALFFQYSTAQPIYDLANHWVHIVLSDSKMNPNQWKLKEGIFVNELNKDQFTVDSDDEYVDKVTKSDKIGWTVKSTPFSNKLIYTIPKDELLSLTSNALVGKYEAYISVLRSKWVTVPVEKGQLNFGFTYDTKSDPKKIATATVQVLNSTSGVLFSNNVASVKSTELMAVDHSGDSAYQVQIRVEINKESLDAVTKKFEESDKPEDDLDDLVITLDNFSVNDPCVGKDNKFDECSSYAAIPASNGKEAIPELNSGSCKRVYTKTNFTSYCKCEKEFLGEQCELRDYCNKGKVYCAKDKKCSNDYKLKQYECECDKDTEVWNAILVKCVKLADLQCKENQFLNALTHKCQCYDGYVSVPSKNNTCIQFDPCNEEHRSQVTPRIAKKPCTSTDATCVKGDKGSYECQCGKGFINLHNVRTSEAKCLKDTCAGCEDKCTSEGKCGTTCGNGYKAGANNTCVIDASSLGCKGEAEIKSDNMPGCKCEPGVKFEPISRLCSTTECSEDALKTCTSKGAVSCKLNGASKPVCSCKASDIPYATNASDTTTINPNNWNCMSRCEVLALPEQHENRCSAAFQRCDTNREFTGLIDPNHKTGTSDSVEGEVFLGGQTQFDASKGKPYCQCELGFGDPGDKGLRCQPNALPTHTIDGMEFDLHPTADEAKYIARVEVAFGHLIEKILNKGKLPNQANVKAHNTKCTKTSDTTLSCQTSFESDKSDTEIRELLDKACVNVNGKCIYLPDKPNAGGSAPAPALRRRRQVQAPPAGVDPDDEILVHDPNQNSQLKVKEVNYCETKNICSHGQYSTCRNDKVKPFECLCDDKPYFEAVDTELITMIKPDKTETKLRIQSCVLKDICSMDTKTYGCAKDAICHASVEQVGAEFKPFSYCGCTGTGLTLVDRSLTCAQTCKGVCGNSDTCGIDYLKNSTICHCSEGWSGQWCGTKSEAAKESNAYMIATIVVSVIAAIALIGLAILFFRRR